MFYLVDLLNTTNTTGGCPVTESSRYDELTKRASTITNVYRENDSAAGVAWFGFRKSLDETSPER